MMLDIIIAVGFGMGVYAAIIFYGMHTGRI